MKRGNEFAVGVAVLAALALVVGGALWLSERDIKGKNEVYVARFRTVGGLGVGAPVTLRGVRVGRVEAIRLARDAWVEAELTVDKEVTLPPRPAVISASNSLFGEWAANIIPLEPLPEGGELLQGLPELPLAADDPDQCLHALLQVGVDRVGVFAPASLEGRQDGPDGRLHREASLGRTAADALPRVLEPGLELQGAAADRGGTRRRTGTVGVDRLGLIDRPAGPDPRERDRTRRGQRPHAGRE